MQMHFRQYQPHPLLKTYIEKIWVFNSNIPIPGDDMKLIVPTGRIKLMIPFRSVSTAHLNGVTHFTKAQAITLVGLTDVPAVVNSAANDPSGTIGIEFNPDGAYRFFRLNYNDLKNQMLSLTDLFGGLGRQLEEQVSNAATSDDKILLLQQFLINKFSINSEDAVFDFCIRKIRATKGRVSVKELEKQTGYSSRWLNMKFIERTGVSPKNLSAIVRFQEVYRAIISGNSAAFNAGLFYDYYYDQSHFIRDFKRFTGMPPQRLTKMVNEFGRLYDEG
ncbi:MAG: AraC family transcriptional regulator [Chitinophagaceae bacterium]